MLRSHRGHRWCRKANPDTRDDKGRRPLDVANDLQMVHHELDREANARAAEARDAQVVRLLLELGARVDENGNGSGEIALMVAARMGHRAVAEVLIDGRSY